MSINYNIICIICRCQFRPPPDDQWGALKEDGTWTGMVGELVANRGDVIAGTLDITVDRAQAVDFLAPFSYSKYLSDNLPNTF